MLERIFGTAIPDDLQPAFAAARAVRPELEAAIAACPTIAALQDLEDQHAMLRRAAATPTARADADQVLGKLTVLTSRRAAARQAANHLRSIERYFDRGETLHSAGALPASVRNALPAGLNPFVTAWPDYGKPAPRPTDGASKRRLSQLRREKQPA